MIYIIEDESARVKIGYSEDEKTLYARKQFLQVGNPEKLKLIGLFEGDKEDEQLIHGWFLDRHIRGEWFNYTDEMMEIGDNILDERPTLKERYNKDEYDLKHKQRKMRQYAEQ